MPDTTILSWITAEVDQALERVRDQIARSGAAPLDARALGGCPEHLHQVSGALNMVGLAGATRFCEALETTLNGLNGSRSEAAEVIERAVAELKAFVDDVARGEPNVPLRLAEVPTPKPGTGEVLLEVKACGVGLTVVNACTGRMGGPTGAMRNRVPGHEIVGVISILDRLSGGAEKIAAAAGAPYVACATIDDIYPDRPDRS